jgi:methyltransferase
VIDPRSAVLGFVAVTGAQRVFELAVSARHARRLAARGAREFGGAHFPWIAALHAGYLVSLGVEVLALGARPGPGWPAWLALWLVAQALRYAAMRALGERWNVRIWVEPGRPRVSTAVYRWIPHPNYLAVVIELVAGPLIFGAWRTALWVGVANALALRRRIALEDRALRWAERRTGRGSSREERRPG